MAKPIDLTEAFAHVVKDVRGRLAKGMSVDITVSGPLVIDVEEADTAPFTVGSLIVERIKHDLEESPLQVQPETRERRRRALNESASRSPTGGRVRAERYPPGWQPNPSGKYGEDSGYLRANFALNIAKGKKDVFAGIPKNRGKAAFVLRRASPLLRDKAELLRAVDRSLQEHIKTIVRKSVRKAFRGTGIRAKIV